MGEARGYWEGYESWEFPNVTEVLKLGHTLRSWKDVLVVLVVRLDEMQRRSNVGNQKCGKKEESRDNVSDVVFRATRGTFCIGLWAHMRLPRRLECQVGFAN